MLHSICTCICYTFNVIPVLAPNNLTRVMKRLIIKSKDRMWPTVIWQGTQLVVYYLGENEDDVEVKETRGIDFEEFFLHLDRGGSIFVTLKPLSGGHECEDPVGTEAAPDEPLWYA